MPKRINGTWHYAVGGTPVDPHAFDIPALNATETTDVACDTMRDLLESWLSDHDYVARQGPATVVALLPSNWNAVEAVPLKVNIVASSTCPRR